MYFVRAQGDTRHTTQRDTHTPTHLRREEKCPLVANVMLSTEGDTGHGSIGQIRSICADRLFLPLRPSWSCSSPMYPHASHSTTAVFSSFPHPSFLPSFVVTARSVFLHLLSFSVFSWQPIHTYIHT